MINLIRLTLLDFELHIIAFFYDILRPWALSAERRGKRMVESAQRKEPL